MLPYLSSVAPWFAHKRGVEGGRGSRRKRETYSGKGGGRKRGKRLFFRLFLSPSVMLLREGQEGSFSSLYV